MPSSLAAITDKAAWLGLIVLGVALVALGDQIGQWRTPTPEPPAPDTVRMEREIMRRDTVTETVPRQVVRYDTVQSTDTVRIAVPPEMTIKGVLPPSPVDVGDEVTLTYFDTEAQQWAQNRYDIQQDTWHAWPSLTASTTPMGLQASAKANLRWQKVTASVGYMQAAEQRGVTASVSIRPFTISW